MGSLSDGFTIGRKATVPEVLAKRNSRTQDLLSRLASALATFGQTRWHLQMRLSMVFKQDGFTKYVFKLVTPLLQGGGYKFTILSVLPSALKVLFGGPKRNPGVWKAIPGSEHDFTRQNDIEKNGVMRVKQALKINPHCKSVEAMVA